MRRTLAGTLIAAAVAAPLMVAAAAPALAAGCGVYSNTPQRGGQYVTAGTGRTGCTNTVLYRGQLAWVNDRAPDYTADRGSGQITNGVANYSFTCSSTGAKSRYWFSEIWADNDRQHSRSVNKLLTC